MAWEVTPFAPDAIADMNFDAVPGDSNSTNQEPVVPAAAVTGGGGRVVFGFCVGGGSEPEVDSAANTLVG